MSLMCLVGVLETVGESWRLSTRIFEQSNTSDSSDSDEASWTSGGGRDEDRIELVCLLCLRAEDNSDDAFPSSSSLSEHSSST